LLLLLNVSALPWLVVFTSEVGTEQHGVAVCIAVCMAVCTHRCETIRKKVQWPSRNGSVQRHMVRSIPTPSIQLQSGPFHHQSTAHRQQPHISHSINSQPHIRQQPQPKQTATQPHARVDGLPERRIVLLRHIESPHPQYSSNRAHSTANRQPIASSHTSATHQQPQHQQTATASANSHTATATHVSMDSLSAS
jgi:hypothetical protein